ncbi:hypothetical protein D3C84_1185970 [compost metagenome]
MQLHGKAVLKVQLATPAQHLQSNRHGQWRAAFQLVGGGHRPGVAVANAHRTQLLDDGWQVGQGEEVVDGRAQLFQWRIIQYLGTEPS